MVKKKNQKSSRLKIFISFSFLSRRRDFCILFFGRNTHKRERDIDVAEEDQSPHILSASFVSHLRDSAKRAGERESLERIERATTTTTTKHRSCSRRREARTRRRRRALFPEEERSQLLLRVNIDSFRGKALRPMIKIAEGEAKR